ncbi:hypothetical protein ACEW7V_01110 [Areca yellow leaf disease phytoplasma]|uniref:hypothetical protein n=1 Tax=Areca yellow leaf disease phytoplasma TaxID=927614 RepID=UPI0035B505C8
MSFSLSRMNNSFISKDENNIDASLNQSKILNNNTKVKTIWNKAKKNASTKKILPTLTPLEPKALRIPIFYFEVWHS